MLVRNICIYQDVQILRHDELSITSGLSLISSSRHAYRIAIQLTFEHIVKEQRYS